LIFGISNEGQLIGMDIYSPGGMPDGSVIQNRDPLMVPSTRRNPVLADVCNRLGYMERKGSGFGKIISGYEFQVNYNEGKKPSFRSDRYQFTVVMPNLNYIVPQDVPQDVPQNVPQDKIDIQILEMLRKNNKISTEKIAIALGVSSKTVKRHIKKMGNVRYIGRGFSGYWEIIDNSNVS
jgi:ATP-dependent DNA helicase RecG